MNKVLKAAWDALSSSGTPPRLDGDKSDAVRAALNYAEAAETRLAEAIEVIKRNVERSEEGHRLAGRIAAGKLAEAELRVVQERSAKEAAAAAVVDLSARLAESERDAILIQREMLHKHALWEKAEAKLVEVERVSTARLAALSQEQVKRAAAEAKLAEYLGPATGNAPVAERDALLAQLAEAEAKLAEAERRAKWPTEALARADNAEARVEALEKTLRRYRDAVSYDHETDTITIVSSVEAMLAQHEADAALAAGKEGS